MIIYKIKRERRLVMKHRLVLTSMVLGAMVCSTSAVVGAANVAPQVSDTAKHDAVQSN